MKFTKSWSLARWLTLGFGALLAIVAILLALFETSLLTLDHHTRVITDDNIPGLTRSSEALEQVLDYRVLTLRHLLTEKPEEWKAIDAECDTLAKATLENLADYERSIWTDEDRALFEKVEPAFEAYRAIARQIRERHAGGDQDGALELANTVAATTFTAYEKAVIELTSFNENFAQENAANISAAMRRARLLTWTAGGCGAALALFAGLFIIRFTRRSVGGATTALNESSAQVAEAATQVSSASQSLAQGASEQAASIEETSASLEEMSGMTRRNADSAQRAKDLSAQTTAAADRGSTQMAEMRKAMDAIKASSDDIAKIIKTIDEIAFQTNILALNAAVEAARAGEAGAGFAVVADEVRRLAQRSAQSAKETAAKIEDAIRKSEHGVDISSHVASALNDIVGKAREVDLLVGEIAQACKEQSQGITQLNTAIGQMDKVTQSNASNAEETAAAAEELTAQAVSMRTAVAALEKLTGASKAPKQAAHRTTQSKTTIPEKTASSTPRSPSAQPTPRVEAKFQLTHHDEAVTTKS